MPGVEAGTDKGTAAGATATEDGSCAAFTASTAKPLRARGVLVAGAGGAAPSGESLTANDGMRALGAFGALVGDSTPSVDCASSLLPAVGATARAAAGGDSGAASAPPDVATARERCLLAEGGVPTSALADVELLGASDGSIASFAAPACAALCARVAGGAPAAAPPVAARREVDLWALRAGGTAPSDDSLAKAGMRALGAAGALIGDSVPSGECASALSLAGGVAVGARKLLCEGCSPLGGVFDARGAPPSAASRAADEAPLFPEETGRRPPATASLDDAEDADDLGLCPRGLLGGVA